MTATNIAVPAASINTEVAFTILESDETLTKSFRPDPPNRPKSIGKGAFSSGSATRVTLVGDAMAVLRRLAGRLCDLSTSQAVMMVPPPLGQDRWRIVTKAQLADHPGCITRSREHFPAVPGRALLALDFDTRGYPPHIRERIKQAGGLSAALAEVFPAFRSAARLKRSSVSSGIRDTQANVTTGQGGQHRFFVIKDGRDAAAFAQRLHQHLVLAGLGFGVVAESGQVNVRSLVDAVASGSERIVYEADADLTDGLEYEPGARKIDLHEGGDLDTSALPELDDDELASFTRRCAQIRSDLAAEAAPVRAAYIERRVQEKIAAGIPEEKARKALERVYETHELSGDFEIQLDDGSCATVREILASPDRYNGKTCADPIEPDYGSGRNLGVISSRGSYGTIFSQAHGGILYRLRLEPTDHFSVLADPPDPSPFASTEADRRPKISFLTLEDILAEPLDDGSEPLINGLLDQGSLSVLYGESNIGKSFLAMSMGFSVAAGLPWAGQHTIQMPVVYIAAEGSRGARWRLRALVLETGVHSAPFHIRISPIDLLRANADLEPLIEAIQAIPGVGLVIIDTLSRVLAGGDENSSVDMGALVRNLDRIKDRTRAHVMAVHHSGKNVAKGARGHSLLRAATDTEIEVAEGRITATKQRDMPMDFERAFTLKPCTLGFGKKGRVITSCTVAFSMKAASQSDSASRAEGEVLSALKYLHDNAPGSTGFTKVDLQNTGLFGDADTEAIRKRVVRMVAKGSVTLCGRGLWRLPKAPAAAKDLPPSNLIEGIFG